MISASIIVPCYNEEAVLADTVEKLLGLLKTLETQGTVSGNSRLYFVDDGSEDTTWDIIEGFSRAEKRICGIRLSRNHGHQRALLAGLLSVDSDVVISIDADLQDDISVIDKMLAEYKNGSDVVYGVRKERQTDSFLKRTSAQFYYRALKVMGVEVVYNHADFRLLSRRALDTLREYREVNLFLRGVIPTIGYPSSIVTYDRSARDAGKSKYPLRRMLSLAIDGITSFSVFPLRVIAIIGIVVSGIAALLSIWVVWSKLTNPAAVPGWASSVLPIYFFGGLQLLGIGIVGEYVGKIYTETKRRPRFIVQSVVGDRATFLERRSGESKQNVS